MRPRKYHVKLREEERKILEEIINKEKTQQVKSNMPKYCWNLDRQNQLNRHHKVTGEVEAQMIAIACSEAPEGSSKWTLQMIADKLVEFLWN